MLKAIGVSSVEDLYQSIPPAIRLKEPLHLKAGLSELEVKQAIEAIAAKNIPLCKYNAFLGAGCYDHYIPAALKTIVSRSEFLTAYTPYQAECSQGALQAIYEYQSYICLLTGMQVANASMLDGASSFSEAVLMALRIKSGKTTVIVADSIHPEYRATLRTYLSGFNGSTSSLDIARDDTEQTERVEGSLTINPEPFDKSSGLSRRVDFKIREVSFNRTGTLDLDVLYANITNDVACFAFQNPNFFGSIEDVEELSKLIKEKEIMSIMVTNPISLALLKSPGALGVDIACGDGQPLGSGLNFGGPSFGFLATKNDYLRQLPGRIVGKTQDKEGKPAYCLTLQAREQHIRREKATSNICSNQSLNAIAAAVYLALLGREGFRNVALYSLNLTHYLYGRLKEIPSIRLPFSAPFFNEFIWEIKDALKVINKLYRKKVIAGLYLGDFYPQLKDCILSCCTEKKTKEDIDGFVQALKDVLGH